MDAIPGLVGTNGTTGNNGANVINAVIDSTITAANAQPASTLTALDSIDGGNDVDVLNINAITAVTVAGGGIATSFPAITVSNVETVNIRAAAAFNGDVSGFTGLTAANVTLAAGALVLTAAATTAVSVTGATAAVTVNGGSTQTLTNDQGANNIVLTKGTNVAVTSTKVTTGTIIIGTNAATTADHPTGTVNVTSTGDAYTAGNVANTLGAITVNGGTTVTVAQTAYSASTAAVTDTTNTGNARVGSAVTVNGDVNTSKVTVTQTATVAAVNGQVAVTGVAETASVVFGALKSGDVLTMISDGADLIFTAAKDMTAAQVAQVFAELINGSTQGYAPAANGTYTISTSLWSSAAASGSTVVFSSSVKSAALTDLSFGLVGTGVAPIVSTTSGLADVALITGVAGVTAGAVVILDDGSKKISDVTLSGYGASSSLNSSGLTTLSLANSNEDLAITNTAANTLALTVNAVGISGNTGVVTGANAYTTVNVTTAGTGSFLDLQATAAKTLTVGGTAALNLAGATLSALETVTVSGTAGLTLAAGPAGTLTSVNTSATTGAVTATIDTTKATYTGGAGVDTVTFSNTTAATKAVSLGAGNDTVNVAAGSSATSTVTIDGGADTDTLAMTAADAQGASAAFAGKFTSFEKLSLGQVATAVSNTVDLSILNYNYVVSAGIAAGVGGALTLTKMANAGTLELTGAAAGLVTTVTMLDATGAADSLNIVTKLSTAAIDYGTVDAAGVETLTLNATDTAATTLLGGIQTATLNIKDAAVKALTVTGNANVTLTYDVNVVALASVDASTGFTGVLTATTSGTVAQTLKGGSGNDLLTAKAGSTSDFLIGGAGNDTLTSNAGLTTLTGGAGNDIFVIGTSLNLNAASVITDGARGDTIKFADAMIAFKSAVLVLDPAGAPNLTDYANLAAAGTAGTGQASWFQLGGNTYIVNDKSAATTFVDGADVIVKLTGLVDLSTASFNDTSNTLLLG